MCRTTSLNRSSPSDALRSARRDAHQSETHLQNPLSRRNDRAATSSPSFNWKAPTSLFGGLPSASINAAKCRRDAGATGPARPGPSKENLRRQARSRSAEPPRSARAESCHARPSGQKLPSRIAFSVRQGACVRTKSSAPKMGCTSSIVKMLRPRHAHRNELVHQPLPFQKRSESCVNQ